MVLKSYSLAWAMIMEIQVRIDTAIKGYVKAILFVDCSTVHPTKMNELTKLIMAKGN
jgi:hypothetical protein